ncbi:hypothetical protein Xoosp13_219 [Xanthomonas phage Xoo-sp13]|nr:hypothetical protein Xoosp13_219 [Xanthomonas phage Xoo-sp13]
MVEKIKIRRLEKTSEYIDREWAEVIAKRQLLLSTSDWTQLEDNELSFESRARWNDWRTKVRSVKRSTVDTKEDAATQLDALEKATPVREFISSRTMRQKKYQIDLTDINIAKSDAMNILKSLHSDWAVNLIPENISLINAKFDEVVRYLGMNPKPKSLNEFPIIEASKKLNGWTRSQVVEEVMNLKRTANEILKTMEEHRFKYTKMIQLATNTDELITIIKNMHGY